MDAVRLVCVVLSFGALIVDASMFPHAYPSQMQCNTGSEYYIRSCFRVTRIGKFTCDLISRCCWDPVEHLCIQRGAIRLNMPDNEDDTNSTVAETNHYNKDTVLGSSSYVDTSRLETGDVTKYSEDDDMMSEEDSSGEYSGEDEEYNTDKEERDDKRKTKQERLALKKEWRRIRKEQKAIEREERKRTNKENRKKSADGSKKEKEPESPYKGMYFQWTKTTFLDSDNPSEEMSEMISGMSSAMLDELDEEEPIKIKKSTD